MKKKILIVTERRADYSKFRPILHAIKNSKNLDYYLIVTGSHLLKEYGNTIQDIQNDGFKITEQFSMYKKNKKDTGAEMCRSFGNAIIRLTDIIEKLKPDIILSGFDIGANFAAAVIGAHMNIVVVHLEGGEISGTIDESIRHATTKFSHIHLTSNQFASKRLIKMGENPKFVFTVGNPSIDMILSVKPMNLKNLENEFSIDFLKPFVLIMQHTVTSEITYVDKYIKTTLDAIKELNIQAILIHGNADAGSAKIAKVIKNSKIKQYTTLQFPKYINLLKNCSALVGNSSSGIMEAPFLHVPSINIGTRQLGRLRQESVIDVNYDKEQIKKAIKKAIYNKRFLKKIKKQKQLYGNGHSSEKIIKILEGINLTNFPIQKQMTY